MSFSTLLDRTLILQRQQFTVDASGSKVPNGYVTVLASIPASIQPTTFKVRNDYAQRQMDVTHKVFTTTNLDAATTDQGGALGGLRLNDRWYDGTNYYLVQDYMVLGNAVVSAESIYESICKVVRS